MSIENDPDWIKIKVEGHKKFINAFLAGKNATEAYQSAYPNASRRTSNEKGYRLKERYKELIERQTYIPSVALERVASRTLENLTQMAFADPAEMLDRNGNPRNLKDIPKALRMAITEVEIDKKGMRFKLGGRTQALQLLAKIAKIDRDEPETQIAIITQEEKNAQLRDILVGAMRREKSERYDTDVIVDGEEGVDDGEKGD
mgnify:CR=1 FL=1